uniref:Purinergic receptor P2Y14 n=1 Tax=Oryzias melastigma TaxID=30732 RepID=A0A3B3CKN3_ORYME
MQHSRKLLTAAFQNKNISSVFTRQVVPVLYCLIFAVGLPLNCMAAWIFFRAPGDSALMVYLKNMVVADLLVLVTVPFRVADDLNPNTTYLRVIVCRYTAMLFYTCLYLEMIFTGFISLDFHVMNFLILFQTPAFVRKMTLLTWGLLVSFVLPNVVLASQPPCNQSYRNCMQLKTKLGLDFYYVTVYFSVGVFLLTLVVLVSSYTFISCQIYKQHRRFQQDSAGVYHRCTRNIFSTLFVFFVCFVPLHVLRLFGDTRSSFLQHHLMEGALLLAALSICFNPILYFLMCPMYRGSLLQSLTQRQKRKEEEPLEANDRRVQTEDT